MDTIKELSCSKRVNDIWEEEYRKSHTKQLILTFPEGCLHTLRMLGPLVFTQRLYIPTVLKDSWGNFISKKEIEHAVNGDILCYVEILKKLKNKIENEKGFKDKTQILKSINDSIQNNGETTIILSEKYDKKKYGMWGNAASQVSQVFRNATNATLTNGFYDSDLESLHHGLGDYGMSKVESVIESDIYTTCRFLNSIRTKVAWQKSIMVNVILRNNLSNRTIKVLCIIPTMLTAFKCAVSSPTPVDVPANVDNTNFLINGLFAHDILIRKNGRGKSSSYNIGFSSSPDFLEDEELKLVFSSGLIDIPSLIKGFNDDPSVSYIYRPILDYKTTSSFVSLLKTETAKKEEDMHMDTVDNSIHKLPSESFEKVDNSSIGSLEL